MKFTPKYNSYFELDYNQLETLVKKEFDIDYEMIPEEELCSAHYTSRVGSGYRSVEPERYNKLLCQLEKAKNGERWVMSYHDYLDLLCYNGVIPAGDYIIDCTW